MIESFSEGRPVIKQNEKTNTNRKGQRMKFSVLAFASIAFVDTNAECYMPRNRSA